jgi:Zn-dependent peptidase ImmA (M78 family)
LWYNSHVIKQIGDIVRGARTRVVRSLDDLAAETGVPIAVLTALERGEIGITTTQLDEVAGALSLDSDALMRGREVPMLVPPSVFLRHSPMQDFDDRDGDTLDAALEQGRRLAALRSLLGEPALALQSGVFSQQEVAADEPKAPAHHGYRLAREVRRWLGNTADEFDDARVLLEERFGVAVVVRGLQSIRATAISVRAESFAAVVLNTRDLHRARNPLLARVYLAHELCHVLFDPSPGGLHIVVDMDADRKAHIAEQRARAFAAELLLPLEGLTRLLGKPQGIAERSAALDLVAQARSRFGTPHEIAANHLCNMNFIDWRLQAWLEAERTSFTGASAATALPVDDGPSKCVADYVERACRDGLITDGEARASLGIDRLAPLPWDEVDL